MIIHWVAIIWKLVFTLEWQANYLSCVILTNIIQFRQRFCAKYFLRNFDRPPCFCYVVENVREGHYFQTLHNCCISYCACMECGNMLCRQPTPHCKPTYWIPCKSHLFGTFKIKPSWTFCAIKWEQINIFRFRKKYFAQKRCENWIM